MRRRTRDIYAEMYDESQLHMEEWTCRGCGHVESSACLPCLQSSIAYHQASCAS